MPKRASAGELISPPANNTCLCDATTLFRPDRHPRTRKPGFQKKKTLNKSLAFGLSNKERCRFNILQERLSRPTDWFRVSRNHARISGHPGPRIHWVSACTGTTSGPARCSKTRSLFDPDHHNPSSRQTKRPQPWGLRPNCLSDGQKEEETVPTLRGRSVDVCELRHQQAQMSSKCAISHRSAAFFAANRPIQAALATSCSMPRKRFALVWVIAWRVGASRPQRSSRPSGSASPIAYG